MATSKLHLGDYAPEFPELKGVDGRTYSLKDFASDKILIIAFTCNHCPYVQAYEDRLVAFQQNFAPMSVRLVAINANATKNYPEETYEEMVKRSALKKFNFPYLRDETQAAATAFGATHTPEIFVFDERRRLRYHGALDDNWKSTALVTKFFLRDAVAALLAGKEVAVPETQSMGCTIKWDE